MAERRELISTRQADTQAHFVLVPSMASYSAQGSVIFRRKFFSGSVISCPILCVAYSLRHAEPMSTWLVRQQKHDMAVRHGAASGVKWWVEHCSCQYLLLTLSLTLGHALACPPLASWCLPYSTRMPDCSIPGKWRDAAPPDHELRPTSPHRPWGSHRNEFTVTD